VDGLTLDQIAVFVAVAEAGSFSAAARKLKRAQSAITYTVQNLELQTGIDVFDRSTYRPTLTPAGRALLPRARRVLDGLTDYRQQARSLLAGIEPRLTIAVDVVAPVALLTNVLKAFNEEYPMVEIVMLAQPMEANLAALRDGIADLGLIVDVPMPGLLDGLQRIVCGQLKSVLVAAPDHPLVRLHKPIRQENLRNYTQLLLSSGVPGGIKDWGAHAVNRWRVNDLGLRRALLLTGVGWSSMPFHLVKEDLSAGRLIELKLDKSNSAERPPSFPISVAHLQTKVFGSAGRWLVDSLAHQ
jgi:DNA-binding transcriptional LysR family regulator